MASITFGGGPTIESRRQFCNLKNGSQVPGYIGYIHQYKYHSGHTYGDQTKILAEKHLGYNRTKSDLSGATIINDDASLPLELRPRAKYALSHELPKAIGGNKLTESMVPGYTGYVPTRKYRFSDTYKAECDQSIDDFMGKKEQKANYTNSLIGTVKSYENLKPIAPNNEIRNRIEHFRDNHPNDVYLQADKRTLTEPPMPGYTGYVPRIVPTELGLGARYHETTKKGFDSFKTDYVRRTMSGDPRYMSADNLPSFAERGAESARQSGTSNKRIFLPIGQVPKYTGYIHGLKYRFGHTYGDSTRELPVCNHTNNNFGEYTKENPSKSVVC